MIFMRTAGIISEYNPFHRGHAWQIGELRRRLGAETAVVCAMSGSFVQRGDFAVMRTHARAEAAVRGGADLVLELPLPWAIASAEGFAAGGVGVLAATGGIFDVLNAATANANFGGGREFRTIICVNIGGMMAGSGSMFGVGLGVMLFHVLWYALRILKVDTNLQLVLIGLILVLAVLLDIQRKRVEARRIVR